MGVTSFVDKPILPFGNPLTSYCYSFELTLSPNQASIERAFDDLVDLGPTILSGDLYNSQFEALIGTINDRGLKWRQTSARLIVLVTNTPPHFAKDGMNTPNLPAWSTPASSTGSCTNQYYPDVTDILDAVTKSETYMMTAVMPGDSQALSYPNYEWLASYLGFTKEFAANIGDSLSLQDAIHAVVDAILGAECQEDGNVVQDEEMTLITGTGIVSATTAPITAAPATTSTAATTALATTPAAATTMTDVTTPTAANTSAQPSLTSAASTGSGQSTNAGSSGDSECQDGCPCPEVMIQLKKLPKAMEFQMNGTGGK